MPDLENSLYKGPVEKTIMIVGKGVTYDTGGVSDLICLFVLNF